MKKFLEEMGKLNTPLTEEEMERLRYVEQIINFLVRSQSCHSRLSGIVYTSIHDTFQQFFTWSVVCHVIRLVMYAWLCMLGYQYYAWLWDNASGEIVTL